jgi:hypothetical protein
MDAAPTVGDMFGLRSGCIVRHLLFGQGICIVGSSPGSGIAGKVMVGCQTEVGPTRLGNSESPWSPHHVIINKLFLGLAQLPDDITSTQLYVVQ